MGNDEITKHCECYGHRDCPHGPVDSTSNSGTKSDEPSPKNVSRISREEALKLAELADHHYDGLKILDEMFPEWAPFEHALCHPCQKCEAPIRYGTLCGKCKSPQENIWNGLAWDVYNDAIREYLNTPNPLMQVFERDLYNDGKGILNYYTNYDYGKGRK